jgi:hypothetical protein
LDEENDSIGKGTDSGEDSDENIKIDFSNKGGK